MAQFDPKKQALIGTSGSLPVPRQDEVARTATRAAIELLDLAAEILTPAPGQTLVMADREHQTSELLHHVQNHSPFDLLVPMKNVQWLQKQLRAIPPERFTRRWAGFATLKPPYQLATRPAGDLFQFVQRSGERPEDYHLSAFKLLLSERLSELDLY